MSEQTAPIEKKQCPEFPYFGASYPDATCIDGLLWDLDSDDDGSFTKGGEDSCPFCNPQAAYQHTATCLDYSEQEEDESDEMYEERMDLQLRMNINALRERYGFPAVTFDPVKE